MAYLDYIFMGLIGAVCLVCLYLLISYRAK